MIPTGMPSEERLCSSKVRESEKESGESSQSFSREISCSSPGVGEQSSLTSLASLILVANMVEFCMLLQYSTASLTADTTCSRDIGLSIYERACREIAERKYSLSE